MTPPALTRRALLAISAASALFPAVAQAQNSTLSPSAMARLADLAGFDPLPRDLLEGLGRALGPEGRALEADSLPDDLQKRVLRGLYSGVLPGSSDARIGFSSALMWAAIEESNNVISYCGGLPGYWANPPETA